MTPEPGPLRWRPFALTAGLAAGMLALGLLVVVTAAFRAPTLVDAVTGGAVGYAHLTRPVPYLLGAPLFGVWDTLSLLTASQHYAVLATVIALYVGARLLAPRRGRGFLVRVGIESGRAAAAFAALLAFYAAGVMLPRPMVGLELTDPDLVAIDFHSHTEHSHDGWSLFSARRNRAWHHAGGFDVAYVTDHYTWRGVDDAKPDNPERAGDGTVLLSGAEVRIHRRPTNILGDRSRYLFALDADSVYMEPDSLRARPLVSGRPATLLYTMPGRLQYVVPFSESDPSGVIAIEINDGSPRGLEQVRSERREILALADSVDLAVIAAANLHGWGRTVAAWSVMRIPGWRTMEPARLGAEIEEILHTERRRAVDVVERRMPYHDGSGAMLAATLPTLVWEHFRMLGPWERLVWLAWLGAVLAALRARGLGAPEERGTVPTPEAA